MEASFKVVISNDPKAILLTNFFLSPVTAFEQFKHPLDGNQSVVRNFKLRNRCLRS